MRNNPLMSKEREDELEKKVHKDLLGKRRVGSKWNSVKDKLPDNPNKRKKYLCTNGYEMFVTEYRDYAQGPDFDSTYGDVTHWMELPTFPDKEI